MNLGTVSQNELSVLIRFISDDKGIFNAKRKIDRLTKDIRVMNSKIARDVSEAVNKSVQPSGIDRYMKDINQGWAKLNKPVKAVKEDMGELNRSFNTVMKSNNLLTKRVSKGFTNVNSVMKTTLTKQEQLNQHTKRFKKPFAGWAMSIMFAGMALQRYSMALYKFGTKAFQEISHSIEGNVTNVDKLEGSMKYLGFTVGQALEPMLEWLIPIVDKLAEWVEKNPKLVAGATKWGIALGTLAMTFGMLVLSVRGFSEALTIAFGYNMMGKITAAGGLFGILKKEVIAVGIALKGMSILGVASFLGIIGGIILVLSYIFKLKSALGGWGEFFKSVLRGILRVNVLVIEGLLAVGSVVTNVILRGVNLVIRAINSLLSSSLVQKGASMLGINVGTIGEVKISPYKWGDAILKDYLNFEESNLSPNQGYREAGQVINNTYIGDIKVEDPMAIEALNNFTRIAGGS